MPVTLGTVALSLDGVGKNGTLGECVVTLLILGQASIGALQVAEDSHCLVV